MRSLVALALLPAAVACGFPKTTDAAPPLTSDAIKKATETTPGTTPESLEDGRAYFVARCNGCHGYPALGSIATSRWPQIIETMGVKQTSTRCTATRSSTTSRPWHPGDDGCILEGHHASRWDSVYSGRETRSWGLGRCVYIAPIAPG